MSATSEGGVILPGAMSVPVDPENPAKGNITPVLSAPELTAAVFQALGEGRAVREKLMGLASTLRDALAETAELLEAVSVLLTAIPLEEVFPEGATDEQDEAYQTLVTYTEGRREAKAQAEADYQYWLATTAPDALEVEGHKVEAAELNDSEAAADDATWD